jgi:iron complex outermembrane receptor protein
MERVKMKNVGLEVKAGLGYSLILASLLCGMATAGYAQRAAHGTDATVAAQTTRESMTDGRISGVVEDPTGAVIAGAAVTLSNVASGWKQSAVTGRHGAFDLAGVPPGQYEIAIQAKGFRAVVLRDVEVKSGAATMVHAVLHLAQVSMRVMVRPLSLKDSSETLHTVTSADRDQSHNTAGLLASVPGVSLRGNGELASVPMLHGLGDERTKLVVNGMSVSNACPNHMNPPLSYLAPTNVGTITVMAGITPVSMGGDSLGGTISVDSPAPAFAMFGGPALEKGNVSSFYRSNGENYGASTSEWIAGRHIGIGYTGSWATSSDYTDGAGRKVTSTYAQSTDATLTLAAQDKGNLLVLRAGLHHIPYQGFVNARMDMVRNYATRVNLQYRKTFAHAMVNAHGFWQSTSHSMNIGHDKAKFPMPMLMPMNDHGVDLGYTVKVEVPIATRQLLRVGNALHRFVLNDTWPPVAGRAPMMGPNSFLNINNGHRTRVGTYVELSSRWSQKWTTLLGVRNDTVWSDTGPVHGYSAMYAADANAFNAANRARTDVDFDATAMLRFKPNAYTNLELGYARKSRAPSLYERYEWSTNLMASSMIGWFGDGNYYVGNIDLKPEIAHTVSGTLTLHDRLNARWQIKATPYVTRIHDYIDVDTLTTVTKGASTFAQLRFANHKAVIYGGDLSGNVALWKNAPFGTGTLSAVGEWLHGERLDTHTALYQMMPLNLRVNLDDAIKLRQGGWSGGVGLDAVNRKSRVDPYRLEQQTPGYTLFNLHTAYRRPHLQLDAAVNNLLNKDYEMPLGGVNMDDFLASGSTSKVEPVTGRGRSAYFSATIRF